MRAYYLAPASFALSNISLRRIKISRLSDLNDPFELLAANLSNHNHRRTFFKVKEELNKSKGLICLSKGWANPLLWGHYAERHSGIALGFDISEELLAKVIYRTQRVRIRIEPNTKSLILGEAVMNRLLRTKFIDWRYEEEFRAFVQLDHSTRENGLYFQDFSDNWQLAEVILGSRCELPIDRLRSLVENRAGSAFSDRVISVRTALYSHNGRSSFDEKTTTQPCPRIQGPDGFGSFAG